MKIILSVIAVCLFSRPAVAQQDPVTRDSVIIDNARIINHDTLLVDVFVSSHDSIVSFEIPLVPITSGMNLFDWEIIKSDVLNKWDIVHTRTYGGEIISLKGEGKEAAVNCVDMRTLLFSLKIPIYYSEKEEPIEKWIFLDHNRSGEKYGIQTIGHVDGTISSAFDFQPFLIYASRDSVRTARIPSMVSARPNYPNPFGSPPDTRFYLTKPQNVRLELRNFLDSLVNVFEEECLPGFHTHLWDYKDLEGNALPSAVYLVHIIAEDTTIVQRLALLK
jgi:hypothetical protein